MGRYEIWYLNKESMADGMGLFLKFNFWKKFISTKSEREQEKNNQHQSNKVTQ